VTAERDLLASHDGGNASAERILDAEDAPELLAQITRQLADAVTGLQQLAQILRKDLGYLGDGEQSHVSNGLARTRASTPRSGSPKSTPAQYLSLQDLAVMLHLDTRSLRRLRRDPTQKFPQPRRFGRALRWQSDEVVAWTERQKERP